jgi:hypothetical protein
MKITHRISAGYKVKTHLSTLVRDEINNSHSPEDAQKDILSNLIEVLAEKNIISLDEIANKILLLDSEDGEEVPILKKDIEFKTV